MRLLQLAHDRLGHFGHRKVINVLNKIFTWLGMSGATEICVLSCVFCQRANKQGQHKVSMLKQQVTTEPFETVASGHRSSRPLPKAKGGV